MSIYSLNDFDFLDNDNWQSDQSTDIHISEIGTDPSLNEHLNYLPEPHSSGYGNMLDSDPLRFGNSSDIYQDEVSLKRIKGQVDFDHNLVDREQSEVDFARSRVNELSDQANHEPNDELAHGYREQMIDFERELESHRRKLEQARADLSIHQQAEYDAEDKLRGAK